MVFYRKRTVDGGRDNVLDLQAPLVLQSIHTMKFSEGENAQLTRRLTASIAIASTLRAA